MGDPIRWGILGTGMAAQSFADGLRHAPGAQLFAVGSRSSETARTFAHSQGAVRSYGAYAQLVADPQVDVVYVATPGERHLEDCLLCLEAGKPVLCEKPFTIDAGEAAQVIDAARRQRLFCMEAMWMRFMPLVQRAKRLATEGAIGEVGALQADFALPDGVGAASGPLELSRGALLNRGVYGLSLASYLLGEPESALGTAIVTAEGVDIHSACLLRFGSGATATLWASTTTFGRNEAAIMGSGGEIRLHEPFYRPHRLSLTRRTAPAPPGGTPGRSAAPRAFVRRLKENPLVQGAFRRLQPLLRRPELDLMEPVRGNGYGYEAIEVMQCLREGRLESAVMPLDETLRIMQLMDRIRRQWSRTTP